MSLHRFEISTEQPMELVDVTQRLKGLVRQSGVTEGSCLVFVPHTTAGLTINENTDPHVRDDILAALERAVPAGGPYTHAEGNAHAHVKASLVGHSVALIVSGGRLALGTWQAVFLCEFDGPRRRELVVKIQADR
ncbi:MAG: secondary thiamine-phosphate synthase enzyme YjbQ [Deltaproteobacteria bacterium]